MPPEGPNKSEELLKRYAKERGEQAPKLSLHPATRRLLQGEVARQFGKRSPIQNRGWFSWFGNLRSRLALGALGAVLVTGACVWWNNQKPQPMEMAKADEPVNGWLSGFAARGDAERPKSEKQIALMNAPLHGRLEDEVRGRSPAAPAERAIQPELKAKQVGDAPVTIATVAGSTFAIESAPGFGTTSTLFSAGFGRGVDLGAVAATALFATTDLDSGTVSSSAARAYPTFESIAGGKNVTNLQSAQLAYNMPVDGLSLPLPSTTLPSVTLSLDEGNELSKLSEDEKPAQNPFLLARKTGEATDRSRRAALPPQAPAAPAAPAPTAQPARALEDMVAADKRQQPVATSQLQDPLVAQASATRPESSESLTRFYRQPAPTEETLAKQKIARELNRLDAEPAVLSRFVIEQQGNSVRVVDADGSVYDGKVEEPVVTEFDTDRFETFEEKKDQLTREKPVALKSAMAAPAEGYSFRASGSNVTLRQLVVVNGRFAPAADTGRIGAAGGAGLGSGPSRSAPASMPKGGAISNRTNGARQPGFGGRYGYATNQPATIEGTVRIGVTNQQWFRAVRDPR